MTVSPPRLTLNHIQRRYGESQQWFAVREASLVVEPGEFLAIVGRSGSGKSTLLNIIGLLDSRWEGSYHLGDIDVRGLSATQIDHLRSTTYGFIFQSSYANPYESTERNATLALAIQGAPLREQSEKVSRALEAVGLDQKAAALARSLSGGERQRLAIARALTTNPSIIVADEPTGNLDSETGDQVMEALLELNRQGATVILVTHDPRIAAYADRTVRMADGVLEITGAENSVGSKLDGQERPSLAVTPSKERRGTRSRRASDRLTRAINNVTSRPLRSVALIAAFALAFAGLIGAAGIGATASQQIAGRLTAAARDEVRVNVPAGTSDEEAAAWLDRLGELPHVREVGQVAPLDANTARTSRFAFTSASGNSPFQGSTVAVDSGLFGVLDIGTSPQSLSRLFSSTKEHVALVGADAGAQLGLSDRGGIGAEVWVNGEPYTVVGTITAAPREPNLLTSVVVPLPPFSAGSRQIVVRTDPGFAGPLASAIPLALSPASPADISVETAAELRNLRVGVQTDLNGLLASLAIALLALAILSGASAMFISVQARTQELALARAVGLGQRGVAAIFLWEGVVIGLAGALAGIAGGLAISVAVAAARGWTAIAPWETIAIAPVAGAVCGALAAFLPAVRAARIDPADAIR
ncbi:MULTISPECIES: ATP-binding cassette domain-containing protein [Leifsonia]|uniref:ABC-type lipoprotein export system ATPase subunit n=5 Tax=Bacteria TaxID=2 RepID=A0A7W4YKJ6_LEIAQ|nr:MULTISPECIES: ATP-binding cassette domain-containing protein [Leifsonia]RDV43202.1 hypothetical protein DOE76_19035 [Leifsonia sp. ku-ls]MBB2969488.1 ABC-type lipoprotein export system ATPase subunit [Leifsonia aquatica]MBO1741509.1 ATP-binding cassette domain-containing protein [Leifsonia sp. TF02-11]MCI0159493.1 ATP-binding cassette domain-containing protein [Leifsonia shinshuensis]MDN4599516.1 ATP-binding cassette domain-containing protein [Leifsonia virtsii]